MSVIDDYIAKLEEPQKSALTHAKNIIRKTVPDAEEVICYGMPVFKYKGKYLIGLAAFKNHMSLFPGAEPIEQLKDKLNGYKLSKGTIQFTVDHPVPDPIIKELLDCRITAIQP